MPSINAMRSLALAGRAKEDILEKVPGFYNSVAQALGSAITQAQDNTQQVMDQRVGAANGMLAKVKQTVDGKGGIVETGIRNAIDLATAIIDTTLIALNPPNATQPTFAAQMAATLLSIAKVVTTQVAFNDTMDAAKYDYLQWSTNAGYTNGIGIDGANVGDPGASDFESIGARGMATHRDALMPRYTNRRRGNAGVQYGGNIGAGGMYDWASVGSISKVGRYATVG